MLIAGAVTLHQHNWCPNLKGIFESIILGQLSRSLIVQQIGKKNEMPRLLVEHIDCLYRDVLELIYRIHQNCSWATWYHSQCGRLMHAIYDCDRLDRLSIRM